MYLSTPSMFSAPGLTQSQRKPAQPSFSGKYSDNAVHAVMKKRYEIKHTYLRYGSEYYFTGQEILERLDEACQERPTRRNGASTLEKIASHPFIERDRLSMQVLEEGLQDLCAIGFAKPFRAGEYLITPAGRNYLYPHDEEPSELG